MCINMPLKVVKITNDTAVMEDGREVRIGLIKDLKNGDYLEVYGDVALEKVAGKNITDRFPPPAGGSRE